MKSDLETDKMIELVDSRCADLNTRLKKLEDLAAFLDGQIVQFEKLAPYDAERIEDLDFRLTRLTNAVALRPGRRLIGTDRPPRDNAERHQETEFDYQAASKARAAAKPPGEIIEELREKRWIRIEITASDEMQDTIKSLLADAVTSSDPCPEKDRPV